MKHILYIGGFEMPNKNAAAQRVLSIAKALREGGYDTLFYGITKSEDYVGCVDGFNYEAYPYPKNILEWISYAKGDKIIEFIKSKHIDYVFTYNYPAIAQERVIKYCRKHKIKVVGDITEWYMHSNLFKKIDTYLRMKWSNKHLDGIISISSYLSSYYKKYNTLQIPPLVDTEDSKWKMPYCDRKTDKIKLIYAGQPGYSKDRLDFIINALSSFSNDRLIFNVVGITYEQYINIFGENKKIHELPIVFHGRIAHDDAIKMLMESDFQIFFRPYLRVNNAGFPTKFVESITAGVPVIMNRISNVDDYLKDGINGIMVKSPEEPDICKALKRVSELTRSEVDFMKRNCDRYQFDFHKYSSKICSFIDAL